MSVGSPHCNRRFSVGDVTKGNRRDIISPMASTADNKDQTHPQEKKDKEIVDRLLREDPNPYNYAELARLRIRYCDFPGAREVQKNLDAVLQRWQLTEEQLFEKTREIHATGQAYKRGSDSQGQDDWT